MAIQKGGAPDARGPAVSQPAARALNGSGELLRRLSERAGAEVLILPSERDAKSFAGLFPKALALSATHLVELENLDLLKGRQVRIWLQQVNEALVFVERLKGVASKISVVEDEGEQSIADWIASGVAAGDVQRFSREHTMPDLEWADERKTVIDFEHFREAKEWRTPPKEPPQIISPPAQEVLRTLPDFESELQCWQYFHLSLGRGSMPYANIDNVQRILAMHPQTEGRYSYDEFAARVLKDGKPWNADQNMTASTLATLLMREVFMHRLSTPMVIEAVEAYSAQRKVHPPKQFLESLPAHDGTRRLGLFFHLGYGAEDNAYTEAAGRVLFCSAIARIYDPGCIVRHSIVLEGVQQAGKTQSLHDLFDPWMLEASSRLDNKDFSQDLQGQWCVELAELATLMKSDTESIKATLTRRDDVYRASFGRRSQSHPRQCIFVGSTNQKVWQIDPTGGTRFLPISCAYVDRDWIQESRAQLFAEALAFYRTKAPWWEMPKELTAAEQEARHAGHPWDELISSWLLGRERVSANEVAEALKIDPEDRPRKWRDIAECMLRIGYEGFSTTLPGPDRMKVRMYRRAAK